MGQFPNEEAWATETGLIDDYDFKIDRSYFTTDARYQGGQTWLLAWEGKATVDGETLDHTILMGLGTGWSSADAGLTVNHEKGKQAFNRSSRYGRVIDRISLASDPNYLGDEAKMAVLSRGTPRQANVWEGMSFHMKREEIDFKGEIGIREWELPVKFLGGGASGGAAAPAGNATSAPAAAAPPAATNGGGGASNKILLAKLRKLATECATHDEFIDKALEMPGVGDDEELTALVADEQAIYGAARA